MEAWGGRTAVCMVESGLRIQSCTQHAHPASSQQQIEMKEEKGEVTVAGSNGERPEGGENHCRGSTWRARVRS